jgi:DNA-binding winged helix-turn-helix (wHTH) protein
MRLDGTLLRDGLPCPISRKESLLLRVLVARAGDLVSSEELQRAGWGETHVSPDSLPRAMSSLRTRLGVEGAIRSYYGRGYCLELPVTRVGSVPLRPLPDRPDLPRLAMAPLVAGPGVAPGVGLEIAEYALLAMGEWDRPRVQVLARESVFSLCRIGLTAVEAARRLQAELAVSGFVRMMGARLRIRQEMVRVADQVQLWCEEFVVDANRLESAGSQMARRLAIRLESAPPAGRQAREAAPAAAETAEDQPGVINQLAAQAENTSSDLEYLERSYDSYQRLRELDGR